MSCKTRIIVLHMKEIIYTAVFFLLAILLGILIFFMFGMEHSGKMPKAKYVPGVYTSSLELGENAFDVEVAVDADNVRAIEMKNLSESMTVMYPLVEPSIKNLEEQLCMGTDLDEITYSEDSKYTTLALLKAISAALDKAAA